MGFAELHSLSKSEVMESGCPYLLEKEDHVSDLDGRAMKILEVKIWKHPPRRLKNETRMAFEQSRNKHGGIILPPWKRHTGF